MTFGRTALRVLPLLLAPACVAYDTSGPPVPRIDGVYAGRFIMEFVNFIELRTDTLDATLILRDLRYRGRFDGHYITEFGDSGLVAGVERPESTIVVSVLGAPAPAKPLAYVVAFRQVYRWCDFARLAPDPLTGRLRNDSLLATGRAALPCFYQLYDQTVEVSTELSINLRASR